MRKKSSYFGLVAILLVSLFPIISSEPFSFNNCDAPIELERVFFNSISDDSNEVNLTWTSRTQQVPQLIENLSIAVGDHVILNATFPQTQNVTDCKLKIWNIQDDVNTTVSCVGSSIALDTYYLASSNQTYSILVTGTTSTDDSIINIWENVSICNFFAPEPSAFFPQTDDDIVFNFTWNCEDQNLDDVNYYSLWLSFDSGVSFMLLERNLTQTWFVWDSYGHLPREYIAMVRAYSVDYSSSECSVDDPPSSYWPGDYSNTISSFWGGYAPTGPIPSYSIGTNSSTYEFGTTNNVITVVFSFSPFRPPLSIEYSVSDNGSLWVQGVYVPESSEGSFTINIDGLSIGTHDLSIRLPFGTINPQSLMIVVTTPAPSNTTTTTTGSPLNWPLIQALAVGVSIGSVAIITIVIILSVRLKRNQVVEYV